MLALNIIIIIIINNNNNNNNIHCTQPEFWK